MADLEQEMQQLLEDTGFADKELPEHITTFVAENAERPWFEVGGELKTLLEQAGDLDHSEPGPTLDEPEPEPDAPDEREVLKSRLEAELANGYKQIEARENVEGELVDIWAERTAKMHAGFTETVDGVVRRTTLKTRMDELKALEDGFEDEFGLRPLFSPQTLEPIQPQQFSGNSRTLVHVPGTE